MAQVDFSWDLQTQISLRTTTTSFKSPDKSAGGASAVGV